MSTKSTRSSGTQHNQRGVTQGNTLVGPQSGLPIDEVVDNQGVRRLAVDAAINANIGNINVDLDYTDDGVHIGDPNTNTVLKVNPDGSLDANVEVDAADGDNIAISDGVNTLAINSDGSINIAGTGVVTPTIANQITTLANTEYSYTFPANTKRFSLRTRGNAKLQISFVSGQSGTNFLTVFAGTKYEEIGLNAPSITAYFQSNKAGEVVEILSWV
jgi:hypothetical protein